MASQFYISTPSTTTPSNAEADSTTSDLFGLHDDYDASTLPFPKPLDRTAFSSPTFSASQFLTQTTSSRFQSLEDLQQDLRALLNTINKELVDLVNDNYTSFLGLGEKLSGGGERVEEVRVGLLGFRRDVEGVREGVKRRRGEVEGLVGVKREMAREGRLGRRLIEVNERVGELEGRMGVAELRTLGRSDGLKVGDGDAADDEEGIELDADEDFDADEQIYLDSDGDELDEVEIPTKLRHNLDRYFILQHLVGKVGQQHPFVLSLRPRIAKLQELLLQDLDTTARAAGMAAVKQTLIQLRVKLVE